MERAVPGLVATSATCKEGETVGSSTSIALGSIGRHWNVTKAAAAKSVLLVKGFGRHD